MAPLHGLVLCGGHSTRMQQDKSNIAYHGLPQWKYLHNLLQPLVNAVYLSCRPGQQHLFAGAQHIITDSVEGNGPAVGLLSAHAALPQAAWLVLACDLPLISLQSLALLVNGRNPGKDATSFISPVNHLPEPLIAIWEPAGLQRLKQGLAEGRQCPRKTLLLGNIQLLENPFAEEQFNANTPEEMQTAREKLGR